MPDEHLFPIPPGRVMEVVAAAYNLTVEQLKEPGWRKPAGPARRVAAQLLHDECWLSWDSIGVLMGLRRGAGGSLVVAGRAADPEALEVLRFRLRPNGSQEALW